MATQTTRYRVVILVLTLTCAGVLTLKHARTSSNDVVPGTIVRVPLNFGLWHGQDLDLKRRVYDILETDHILHRVYRSETGETAFLSIVHYTETKVDFHSPEGCLGGSGTRLRRQRHSIRFQHRGTQVNLQVNDLLVDHSQGRTLVNYFYKAGDFLGTGYIRLRWTLVMNKVFNRGKSASLIRLSSPIGPAGEEKARETLEAFLRDLYPFLIEYL